MGRDFLKHPTCVRRQACEACRDEGYRGDGWRESLAGAGFALPVIPPDARTWPCPHGVTASSAPSHSAGPSTTPGPVPREKWPAWATAASKLAAPGDQGVGDTVARCTAASGVASVVEWVKRQTGFDCGCCDRRAAWNAMYPYRGDMFDGPSTGGRTTIEGA